MGSAYLAWKASIETFNAAREREERLRVESSKRNREDSSEQKLALLVAQIAALEAEDAMRAAAALASEEADARDEAEGDDLVTSFRCRSLRSDLLDLRREQDRLRHEIQLLDRTVTLRIQRAREAWQKVASRRLLRGEAPPLPLPGTDDPKGLLAALETLGEGAPKPSKSNEARLVALRREEFERRLSLEERYQAAQDAAKEAREAERVRKEQATAERKAEEERLASVTARNAAEIARREALVSAQREREARSR